MDVATLLGLVSGFGLIFWAILQGSSMSAFLDGPSALIVVGGTIASTLISERLGRVISAFRIAMNAFTNRCPAVDETISEIAELSVVVRKEGLLALENREITNPFLAKGVRLAVDGIAPEEIQSSLRSELVALRERHKRGQKLFKFMASSAPAMGMIGTLVGLVQMLQSLDDPSAIGPSMAVALITTFYGALLAFVLFGPLAQKLEHRTTEEVANMVVIVEGLDSIMKGENARIVKEKLEGHLAPKLRSREEAA